MKRYWLLVLYITILVFLGCTVPGSVETPAEVPALSPTPAPEPTQEPTEPAYGPELEISGDWTIDNETVVVTPEQPIHFVQDYHEQHKIIVRNGGCLKILGSYIRSDFRFLLELHDTSKLIVENSQLIWQGNGAVITNLDSSVVQATNSELDFVGIASGNRPPLYTTVDLSNCSIRQLEIDLFDLPSILIEGIGRGFIQDRTVSSDRFRMTLRNCSITNEVTSWIGDVEATFRHCNLGQVSPDQGSRLTLDKCTIREVVPRIGGYKGVISNLPSGPISSFQLELPLPQSLSIRVVDSIIKNGWYVRYHGGSKIEFRNCHFSVLRPMGYNYASIQDSIVKELWIWDTSGEIHFYNSPIGWIGNVMNYPSQRNDILLSGDIIVDDEDWRKRLYRWGDTVIKREFLFSLEQGSGECVLKNEEGTIVDQFVVDTSRTKRVLVFDGVEKHYEVYVNGTYRKTLELSSDSSVQFPEQVELKYDDGISDGSCSSGHQGFLVHFSPPATPFMVSEVKVFASLRGSGYEKQTAWFEIRDQNFDQLYCLQKSAITFSHEPSWAVVEIPGLPVSDDFYIVFYPCSTKEGGVYLHYDLSQVNQYSEAAEPGGTITDWVWNMPKEKTNWMIRVVGAPTDEVVAIPSPPFQTIEGPADFREIVNSLDNPRKLSRWMVDNIEVESHYERWKETGINYIATPDETFKTKVGCCAEFAVFACYVLQYHNYQAEILLIKVESDPSKNHAVCVYQSSGSLWTMNVSRINGPYQTYEDIAFDYHNGWSEYAIYYSWDKYQKLGPSDKVVHRKQ